MRGVKVWKGCPTVTQQLHSGYTVVTQQLQSGYTVATQWLHSGYTGIIQRLHPTVTQLGGYLPVGVALADARQNEESEDAVQRRREG